MLHAAAKVVARERGGKFPATAKELRALPGVGRYTAAAIASIAFGEPVAVVDGNVERVLQRVSGRRLTGEDFWLQAERLLDRERPGDFNQAMMELGATVCTPRAPACLSCPVVELCATRGELAGSSEGAAAEEAGNSLRSRLSSWECISDAAGAGRAVDGGDVGVAGGVSAGRKRKADSSRSAVGMTNRRGDSPFIVHPETFDYGDGLHGARLADGFASDN